MLMIKQMQGKPVGSPPGYPPRLLLIGQLTGSPASIESVNWFTCIQRSSCTSCRTLPSTEWHTNPILWIEADKTKNGCQGNVP